MHRRIVFAVSAVLFAPLAPAAGIVADLNDRGSPVQLGAKSAVSLDFGESGMSDEEAFRQLGMLSDRLGIGLIKVAPDLSGDQSGQVFVAVGGQDSFPDRIQRFGDQPDAEIRENAALAHSYASGQYLITGETTHLAEFKAWVTAHQISNRWFDDSLGDTLQYVVRERSFATSLLAGTALMVSLVLYWLSVKAKGRALRVLAGVSTWRIQYEDLGGFLAAMSAAAVVCNVVAVVYVGLSHGWVFVPYYAWGVADIGCHRDPRDDDLRGGDVRGLMANCQDALSPRASGQEPADECGRPEGFHHSLGPGGGRPRLRRLHGFAGGCGPAGPVEVPGRPGGYIVPSGDR